MITHGLLSPALLDAASDVGAACTKLENYRDDQYVAIRRQRDLVVFWYIWKVGDLVKKISKHADAKLLTEVLDLNEDSSSKVVSFSESVKPITSSSPIVVYDEESGRVCILEPKSADNVSNGSGIERAAPDIPQSGSSEGVGGRGGRGGRGGKGGKSFSKSRVRRNVKKSEDEQIPTFMVFPKVRGPNTVAPGGQFSLRIGLGLVADTLSGRSSFGLDLPDGTTNFDLAIRVVADGYESPTGWEHVLTVDRSAPDESVLKIELIAPEVDRPFPSTILVLFHYEGILRGAANWKIAVVPDNQGIYDDPRDNGKLWRQEEDSTHAKVLLSIEPPSIDLTVCITKPDGNPVSGRYQMTFVTPHKVKISNESYLIDLGEDAANFAREIIDAVRSNDGSDLLEFTISGMGSKIARAVPTEFFQNIRVVWDCVREEDPNRIPNILIATSESYVPWELALLDSPLDPLRPPYLGSQVYVSRWILGTRGIQLPPPSVVSIRHMAVVVGNYVPTSGYRELEHAIEEGEHLEAKYGAKMLNANPYDVATLLKAQVPLNGSVAGVEAVHFACHGEVGPGTSVDAAIILEEGQRLRPEVFETCPLSDKYKPFLFLNACEVGTATQMLGEFAGFSGSALVGGCRGFVGPLWPVNDEMAHQLAVDFYESTFGKTSSEPISVAQALYELRGRFNKNRKAATWLSYVFYGHPGLVLKREA